MAWSDFRNKAQALGFEVDVELEGRVSERPGAWLRVGGYGGGGALWARPITEDARRLAAERVAAVLAGCDVHVEIAGEHGAGYQIAAAPGVAAINMVHSEWARFDRRRVARS